MEIRKAEMKDVDRLAELMTQLGYPTSVEQMKQRFANMESNSDYHTLVALYDGNVVGVLGLLKGYYYELDGSYARIVAFVVDSTYRNKGIGKRLLNEAENWARRVGATGIGLNSGDRPERRDAHAFYRKMGYEDKSIGFAKGLE
ncbi:GNAT family N-acetyltransferase [Fredinandcohnia humi]